jgi:hypothetical protein
MANQYLLYPFIRFGYCVINTKLKQRWSATPPKSTNRTSISRLKPLTIKQTTAYNVGNASPGFETGTKLWWC